MQEEKKKKDQFRQDLAQKKKLKLEIGQIEKQISTLTAEKEKIEKLFETLLSSDEIIELSEKLNEIKKQLDIIEEKWFLLYEEL